MNYREMRELLGAKLELQCDPSLKQTNSDRLGVEKEGNKATFDTHELFIIITIIVFASSFTSTSAALEAKQGRAIERLTWHVNKRY